MSSRRGFLRSLVGEVVRGAQEIAPVLNLPGELVGQATDGGLAVEAPSPGTRHTLRATPALRAVTLDELLELGWSWGKHRNRLYMWINDEDLAARDFSRMWAIAQ